MKKYLLLLLLASFSIEAQIINIPDANFKAKLLQASPSNNIAKNENNQSIKIDVNNDGEIQESEADLVYRLSVQNSEIVDIEGIQNFININHLNLSNNSITNIEQVMSLISLVDLDIKANNITIIDFTSNNFIYTNNPHPNYGYFTINFNDNPLQILNLTGLLYLDEFRCENTFIEELVIDTIYFVGSDFVNIKNNPNLTEININIENTSSLSIQNNNSLNSITLNLFNSLNTFTVSQNQSLENIVINKLGIPNLDFFDLISILDNINLNNFSINTFSNDNLEINNLWLMDSQIQSLDLSNVDFNFIWIATFNQLEILNIKNGNSINPEDAYTINGVPNLRYICANDDEVDYIKNYFLENEIYDVNVNSYCSFTPGGEFFTIQSNSKLDLSANGCDENDFDFPSMQFTVTDGTISGNVISNTSGNYSIPVQAGTHTVTPVFENPAYFNVSPSNFTVSFPTEASPYTQNFCVTPNGVHQDVEVTVIPTGPARPGFDSYYSIIFKNKGNTVVSGTLSLTFTDNVMDFVSSNPIQTMVEPNINILNWNYSNLQPFETRDIQVVFNLNSPQETPALNGGEILEFIAIVDPLSGDEMSSDNTSTLNQEVVNSYDPNDKTCLEGSVVSTELIGQYVHYVIRFENTGTFFAQNVVVKDEIDLAKFDLSTLIPQHSSHDYFARINGNKVEFIFENIQLPFPPSEERHGYIAFKIKLKNDLTVGDTFSNFASIYFDYNFPIITEPATTSIEALSNPDFEFSNFVKLYPNPTNSIVTIESQSSINLKSVEIFNSLGQLIQAIPNDNNQLNVDVSNLQTGTYFIKVYSDKGVGVSKFIKQ